MTQHLPADHLLRIYLMLEGEKLSSFTQGDEDYFSLAVHTNPFDPDATIAVTR